MRKPIFIMLVLLVMTSFTRGKNSDPLFEKKLSKMKAAEVDTLYTGMRRSLESKRVTLKNSWKGADEAKRQKLRAEARSLLLNYFSDSLLPCWYGTEWDFNGTSSWPRKGTIACGYFVTTLLKHSGFNIQRTHLAQQASSVMIRTFCPPGKIKIISDNQTKKVFDYMALQPDGIYLLGLDNHTGFIIKENGKSDFVHSNYLSYVDKVVREPLAQSSIILANNYFMIGNLSGTDATIAKWITGEAFE
jgi:hypothetical protein